MQLRYRSVLLLLLIIINYGYGAADPLNIGEPLPVIQGETLEGKSLEFPAACAGKITLIVFSFTKKRVRLQGNGATGMKRNLVGIQM
jgi:hypothetical protein